MKSVLKRIVGTIPVLIGVVLLIFIMLRIIPGNAAAVLLGAVPLMFGFGTGAELRQPLGIAVVGGLLVSQALTLFTTPVIYLALERLFHRRQAARAAAPSAS